MEVVTTTISSLLANVPLMGQNASLAAPGGLSWEKKGFVMVSMALVTVCTLINIILGFSLVSRRGWLLGDTIKSPLLMSQAISGIAATLVVEFPLSVIKNNAADVSEQSFFTCYIGHSMVIVLAILTTVTSATLLLFSRLLGAQNDALHWRWWGIVIWAQWLWGLGVALLPYLGINTWNHHDKMCHLSTIWPLPFATALMLIVVGQIIAVICGSIRARSFSQHQHRLGEVIADDTANQADQLPAVATVEGESRGSGWVEWTCFSVSTVSVVPLLTDVILTSSCAATPQCVHSPHHYHEHAAELPWNSLFMMIAGIINAVLLIYTDDKLYKSMRNIVTLRWCTARDQTAAVSGITSHKISKTDTAKQKEQNVDIQGTYVTTDDHHCLVGDV